MNALQAVCWGEIGLAVVVDVADDEFGEGAEIAQLIGELDYGGGEGESVDCEAGDRELLVFVHFEVIF